MKKLYRGLSLALVLCSLGRASAPENPSWTAAQAPFHIAGNLYYVGSQDLAAFLVVTSAGNILINENLESSPPRIQASVERLGFRWRDTRILLNGQAHFDHAAGSAQIIRETGATLMVMEGDAETIEHGGDAVGRFPSAHVSRTLHDGDTVGLGGTVLTAHKTAGHTRGCTTWTMVVNEGSRKLNVVIVGGWSVLDSYRLTATLGHPATYPYIKEDFEHSFKLWRSLPCDIFLGAHGSYFDMQDKLKRLRLKGPGVWIDPRGYAKAINEAEHDFQMHLAQERP